MLCSAGAAATRNQEKRGDKAVDCRAAEVEEEACRVEWWWRRDHSSKYIADISRLGGPGDLSWGHYSTN